MTSWCNACYQWHLAQCPTCGNRAPKDPEDLMWWWTRSCIFCNVILCNAIVARKPTEGTSSNCWIDHVRKCHPERL